MSELVRSKIDPALKDFGGATGATWTMRPRLSLRLIRSSSGVSATEALPLKATYPTPGVDRPLPEIAPVVVASRKCISAACTEPATARST